MYVLSVNTHWECVGCKYLWECTYHVYPLEKVVMENERIIFFMKAYVHKSTNPVIEFPIMQLVTQHYLEICINMVNHISQD